MNRYTKKNKYLVKADRKIMIAYRMPGSSPLVVEVNDLVNCGHVAVPVLLVLPDTCKGGT